MNKHTVVHQLLISFWKISIQLLTNQHTIHNQLKFRLQKINIQLLPSDQSNCSFWQKKSVEFENYSCSFWQIHVKLLLDLNDTGDIKHSRCCLYLCGYFVSFENVSLKSLKIVQKLGKNMQFFRGGKGITF